MNETWIRELAERYGLTVLKRITTGDESKHFATFELTGQQDRLEAAWLSVKAADWPRTHGKDYAPFAFFRFSDDPAEKGKRYIAIESVWCE